MESNQNTSSINAVFGENPGDNPKINIKLNVNFNQVKAKAQIDKLHSLTQISDLYNALVILLKSSPEKKAKLVDHIKGIFENQVNTPMAKDLSKAVKSDILNYSVSETDSGVKLIIKPGAQILQPIEEQIEAFLAMGLSDIVETQTNSLTLSLTSNQSFSEITKDVAEEKYTFASSLLKSFKAQLILNLNQNIITAVFQLLKGVGIDVEETPVGFLQLFKNLEIDLKFSSTEELPEILRSALLKHKEFKYGLTVSPSVGAESKESFKKLVECIDNGIDLYVTLKNIGAAHIEINGAGFGDHFTSRIKE